MLIETVVSQDFILNMVLGLYLLIMACVFLFRSNYYRLLIDQTKSPGFSTMLIAALGLLVALFLIMTHNIWVFDSRLHITILCWTFLLNAILWLAAPGYMLNLLKKLFSGKGYYVAIALMMVLSGQMLSSAAYVYLYH